MSFVISYSKKYGLPLMLLLPLLIIAFLILNDFSTDGFILIPIIFLWILLLLNSILVSLSGFSLSRNFNKEVDRLHSTGFPIRSSQGFPNMYSKIRYVFSSSLFISIIIFISLITFLSILIIDSFLPPGDPEKVKETLKYLIILVAFSLILIAIGISILLSLPDAPALVPGALMKYYSPTTIPSQIDNFLSDTIFPFLDPITRTRWDEWGEYVLSNLLDDFESEEDPQTRLEIAREKILLFAYLNSSIPETITSDIIFSELSEMFKSKESIQGLFEGKNSGITWNLLLEIVEKVQDNAPEVFDVIDRLIIELKDNLSSFKSKDLWITVSAPSTVSGNMKPFRILVFILNKDSKNFGDQKRPVTVKCVADGKQVPDNYSIRLDEAEGMNIHSDKLPLTSSNGEDIVGLLGRILQVGDAVWFQEYRKNFGHHLFNIRVEEGNGAIFGRSLDIQVKRDLVFFAQQYGGKLSALSGAVIPIAGILFSGFV